MVARHHTHRLLAFQKATDLRTYVSTTCKLVLKWEQENLTYLGIGSAGHANAGGDVARLPVHHVVTGAPGLIGPTG
ncbi:hypothetical protein [Streptomyces sp. NPDC057460]|uniref:hypothetical protein n=1 Tax=Streptomyces sp. NPDC057460 TaxID=3346141 RepID=UPI0036A2A979